MMLCNKCKHTLPDDSEFCQYCGNRIEVAAETTVPHDSVLPENVLKEIVEIQVKETVKAMDANRQSQPDHEGDADFGLVPEKPIYTHALRSVTGEEEYLNTLRTVNGEKITWKRCGSKSVAGINGLIDIYDTYLPSGQPYKTIYINMYGAKPSTKAPRGFVLCGTDAVPKQANLSNDPIGAGKKYFAVAGILSIVLSAIAALCVIIAMNMQDALRNTCEDISPTSLYFFLIGIYSASILLFFLSKEQRHPIIQHLFPVIPVFFAIGALLEGSIFSSTYISDSTSYAYINSVPVNVLNILWVLLSFAVWIINLVALVVKVRAKWRASLRYREICYERVAKMKAYLDAGIITEEEYKKNKEEILRTIDM